MEEHAQHLEKVLQLLEDNKLFAKAEKCLFAQNKIEFLGHTISANGIEVDQAKVQAVMHWPEPRNVHYVRAFLGLCSYYTKFVKGFAQIALPLTDLTRKEVQWHYGSEDK